MRRAGTKRPSPFKHICRGCAEFAGDVRKCLPSLLREYSNQSGLNKEQLERSHTVTSYYAFHYHIMEVWMQDSNRISKKRLLHPKPRAGASWNTRFSYPIYIGNVAVFCQVIPSGVVWQHRHFKCFCCWRPYGNRIRNVWASPLVRL